MGTSAILSLVAKVVPFDKLTNADLTVEAVYEGGTVGNSGDDPLGKIVPVGNQGGFRYAGSPKKDDLRLVVLYTSGADRDWPDALDRETGLFTYFGDNREPGKDLHDTSRGGNAILAPASTGCTAVRQLAKGFRHSSYSTRPIKAVAAT